MLTVCEEVGLLGASAMDFSDLEGRILVNIDSEEEGVLTAGCAGGRRVECHLPITRAAVTGTAVKADIAGLVEGTPAPRFTKAAPTPLLCWAAG